MAFRSTAAIPYDDLLSETTGEFEGPFEAPLKRSLATYVSHADRFIPKQKQTLFQNQFNKLYGVRLKLLRQHAEQRARKKWPDVPLLPRILDVEEGNEVVIVGTLYKEMPLKPSILDEYAKDRGIVGQILKRQSFISPEDMLVLEDESGRIRLSTSVEQIRTLVTGLIVAVKGKDDGRGEFIVSDIAFPLPAPAPPLPRIKEHKYVAFMSGLHFGDSRQNPLPLKLAVDFLTGHLGSTAGYWIKDIVRLVIAGDSLSEAHNLAASEMHTKTISRLPSKDQTAIQMQNVVRPLRELDVVLTQLATSLPIELMPGQFDPSNYALPQQPFHPCLFPIASTYTSVTFATNPNLFSVDGVTFLGTSGQTIEDLSKYVTPKGRIDLMEDTLLWGHCAPTAPDTLTSYPYPDTDPFVLHQYPHVYFVGNQPSFETRLFTPEHAPPVRLISVPCFSLTSTIVLLDLATLECHPVEFTGL